MPEVHPTDKGSRLVRLTFLGMLGAFVLLGVRLWFIQVAHGAKYRDDAYRQQIRRVRLPGARGRIYDRNGVPLAENRPSYCVALYVNEFRQVGKWDNTIDAVQDALQELSTSLELPVTITREKIRAHIKKRLPLPLLAWQDVSDAAVARLAVRQLSMRGVGIYVQPIRVYPQGKLCAHVVGCARGRRDGGRALVSAEDEGRFHTFYLPELRGEWGIEKTLDDVLSGKAGGRLIRVDASGYERRLDKDPVNREYRNPEVGQDVYLTIDVDVQRYAEQALTNLVGSVVVVDPRNGDLLAMASSPGYDLNEFIPRISKDRYAELDSDPGRPFVNRAVSGLYPPGSTFKPIVAIAALQNGLPKPLRSRQEYNCPGHYALGRTQLKCWIAKYNKGHGMLDMRKSMEQSCNTYFCELGVAIGYKPVYYTAQAMGLGQTTGIVLDGEKPGVLPEPRHIRSRGDLCNVSIGQGQVAATPLQMAMVTATIANKGLRYRPRLVSRTVRSPDGYATEYPPELIEDLQWARETIMTVRGGMRDVIQTPRGTGKRARLEGVQMAGKTGTAEYGPKSEGRQHGWMIAFAPYENPRYAVAIVVDDAASGGITVAPRMREFMRHLFFPYAGAPVTPVATAEVSGE